MFEPPPGVISCADMAAVPSLGQCTPGAVTAEISPNFCGADFGPTTRQATTIWPSTSYSLADLASLRVQSIIVGTDGSHTVLERARTVLENAYPAAAFVPSTIEEDRVENAKQIEEYQQLADVLLLTSLPIAGGSLAASASAGLTERKRPFSLLRLSGASLAVLRRVVAYESAA